MHPVNATNRYQQNMSPTLHNTSQGSPKIHMSVREMHSTSSVSSVGSTQSASASANGPERRNSSVIVIEHVERISMAPEGTPDSTANPSAKLKHLDRNQMLDSNIQQCHSPTQHSSAPNPNYRQEPHLGNVPMDSSNYSKPVSVDQTQGKSNELVSAHIFV